MAYSKIVNDKKEKKHVPSFSKTGFNDNTRELLNNNGYTVKTVTTKGGQTVVTEQFPVQEFRKDIAKILKEHGVDNQEVTKVTDGTYQFPKMHGLYGLMSAAIIDYMEKGNRFNFQSTETLKASLVMNHVEESTKEYKKFNSDEKVKIKTGAHDKLKLSSKAPAHLKEKK